MIQVTIYQNTQGRFRGFVISGHAGYASRGKDIICAAVSALSLNFVHSVEHLTKDPFRTECEEEKGILRFKFLGTASRQSILLMESMILGMQSIRDSYGENYVNIRFKEV